MYVLQIIVIYRFSLSVGLAKESQILGPVDPLGSPHKCFIQHQYSVVFCYVIEMGRRFE